MQLELSVLVAASDLLPLSTKQQKWITFCIALLWYCSFRELFLNKNGLRGKLKSPSSICDEWMLDDVGS